MWANFVTNQSTDLVSRVVDPRGLADVHLHFQFLRLLVKRDIGFARPVDADTVVCDSRDGPKESRYVYVCVCDSINIIKSLLTGYSHCQEGGYYKCIVLPI